MGQVSSAETKQLFKAAKQGKYDVVAEMVGRNPSVIAASEWMGGQTVWHIAAIHGQLLVIKAIESALSEGPTGPDSWRPLLRLGNSLQSILENVVNRGDSRVRTPLHYACMNGHAEVAALLIDLGADPWLGDMLGGRTCLHYAAAAGHPDCIKAVLSKRGGRHPIDQPPRPNRPDTKLVDVRNSGGFSPLHYAVWASQADAVQALLSFEAYLFPRNMAPSGDWIQCAEGSTPLHLAAIKGNVDVAKVLLKSYAECMVLDNGAGAASPVSRHRNNLPDPRLVLNGRNQLSFQIAQRLGNQAMAEILHPSIPFAFLFSSSDFHADTRMFGPCRLAVLAANALQQKLKQDIQAAVDKLQALTSHPEQLMSASLDALLAKPAMNGGTAQCDLTISGDQGSELHPMNHKAESSPSLATASSSIITATADKEHSASLSHSLSEPAPSPFRVPDSAASGLFKHWTGHEGSPPQTQASGRSQVKEVDVQLRMRVSSRRLLSLGSMERNAAPPPAQEEAPVEESVHPQTQFTLEDTLPYISGRLGGDKEAFRQQFRLLRLTAGVQQANWQLGQPLLPPQRARSVPKPLSLKSSLKRTNTDSPATLLALSQDPPLITVQSDPAHNISSQQPGSSPSSPNLDSRPPRPRSSPASKTNAASVAEDAGATQVVARSPPPSTGSTRRTVSGASRSAFVTSLDALKERTPRTEPSGEPSAGEAAPCAAGAGSASQPLASGGAFAAAAQVKVTFDDDNDEDDDDDEGDCEICMDKPLQLTIVACKHKLCVDCASELCKLHHFRPALCPFCRSIISGFKTYGV